MAHFHPHGFLLVVLVLVKVKSECRDVSTLAEPVFASVEEDVLLPCFDPLVMDPKSCSRVRLIKYATNTSQMKVIFARPTTPKFQDAKRIKWRADGAGKMSLFMTKSQKSDEGLYRCEIWQSWDCILVKNISFKVKDCKTLQAVKAAPSVPVNLSCPMDTTSGQPGPQNVSWTMLKGGDPIPISSTRVEMSWTSLLVRSVNHSDGGWYRCTYVFGQTQRCFDMNLLVQEAENISVTITPTVQGLTTSQNILEPRTEETSRTFIAATVAPVVTGVAMTAALIGLFIYCRRNTHRHTAGQQEVYEIVNPTLWEDRRNQQSKANSLYQPSLEEGLYTF